MKLQRRLLLFISTVGLLLIAVSVAADAPTLKLPQTHCVLIEQTAPPITSWDLHDNVVSAKKILAKPEVKGLLVCFYASWCRECKKGLDLLRRNKARLEALQIKVLMINCGESKAIAKRYDNKHKFPFLTAMDEFGEIQKAYGVTRMPMSFLIGKDLKVKAIYICKGDDFISTLIEDCNQ